MRNFNALPTQATPQSEFAACEYAPAVPGFRYLMRRFPVASLGVAVSLFAATLCVVPAHARKSSAKYSRTARVAKPTGVWAWTSGSATYIRSRPGTQTPPVAKVPRHTKLFVWGKFNGWYRVETQDNKFGWIHSDYLNSRGLEKVDEMSHAKAKQASDRTENQVMYGSVEMLKKHYQRYGAVGAKKGLQQMGVKLATSPKPAKSTAKPQSRFAKPAPAKSAQKMAAMPQSVVPQAEKTAPVAKTVVKTIAKPVVAKPVAAKPVAKSAPRVVEQPRTLAPAVEATQNATAPAAIAVAMPVSNPLHPSLPNPTTAGSQVAPQPVAKSQPQPVKSAPAKRVYVRPLAPAIPLTPRSARGKGNGVSPPTISADEVLRAREQHMRQKTVPVAPVYEQDDTPLFVPSSYARPALPQNHFSPRDERDDDGFRPLTLDLDYARPKTRVESDIPPSLLKITKEDAAEKATTPSPATVVAKNSTAKPFVPKNTLTPVATKASAKVAPAKAAAPAAAPSRGGSPRDLMRVANGSAAFGAGLANSALSYRGRPYIRGAASPSRGFDCSGLIYFLLRQRGITPPRTAAGLARYGKPVPMGQLQSGDIVLFANTYKRGVSHVGIYMGDNKFVHAATSGSGVRVDSLGSPYYARKYYGARRVN